MNLITREDYEKIITIEKYYRVGPPSERWSYIEIALQWLKEMCPKKTLEVGAYIFPLDKNGWYIDIMDYSGRLGSRFVRHDARNTPWPFAYKEFDVVISLQVWEHLLGGQKKAFAELTRVGKSAILSLPYMWTDGDADHIGIDKRVISEWFLGNFPSKEVIIPGIKNRIIQLYKF